MSLNTAYTIGYLVGATILGGILLALTSGVSMWLVAPVVLAVNFGADWLFQRWVKRIKSRP